jgi:hypothetical protein
MRGVFSTKFAEPGKTCLIGARQIVPSCLYLLRMESVVAEVRNLQLLG